MGIDKRHDRSFAWLNTTQFFGALNDNIFQMLVIFFLTFLAGGGTDAQASIMASSMIYFVLPFLLFSHAAGVLADRFSKRNVIVSTKIVEVVVMLGGLLAVIFAQPAFSSAVLYAMIFLMCSQSAFFGPSKMGIIPELVERTRLSQANGLLVGLTYLAIILGTFVPSYVIDRLFPGNYLMLSLICIAISVAGLLSSFGISKTPAMHNTSRKFSLLFPVDMFKTMCRIKDDKHLFLTVLGASYFLFLGAFIKLNILIYGQQHLGLTQAQSGYLFPMAALGIGLGGVLAGKLSGRNIEFGIVPIGAVGLAICCFAYSVISASTISALVITFFVGVSTGLFIVPLNSFIQYRSPKGQLGEIIACQNFLSFLGVILAAAALKLLTSVLDLSAASSFAVVGALTLMLAAAATVVLPDFLVRFVILVLTKLIYKIKVKGINNLPAEGPALLVPNHVTWVDALLLSATQQRRIRFIMSRDVYNKSVLTRPILKLMRVILISPKDNPREIVKSLQEARAALEDGWITCIFAEGALTRNGNMQAFRGGLEKIVKNTGAPVIPAYIGGGWGSIFSYYHGKLFTWPPQKVPYPITIIYGRRMPDTSTSADVRLAVQELSCEYFDLKKSKRRNLPMRFILNARRNWNRQAISDTTGKSMTFGKTLIAALALERLLKRMTEGQDKIGVLLPSSVAGVLTNASIALMGKTSVNLNFTASQSGFDAAIEQCELRTIITSRAFVDKLEALEIPDSAVYMEDLAKEITGKDKLNALLKATLLPAHMVSIGASKSRPDDTATIIFSSGSTAQPKGIMLTHHNIISNIEQISAVYHFGPKIGICGILPFFHSFGYTVTLWCPLTTGTRAAYHPNPVDGPKIGEIVRENKLNMLFTTPTFLLVYIRKVPKEDFASLNFVITGAEKLQDRVAQSFEKRFSIKAFEGYGTTELSPVASVNLPHTTIDNFTQTGNKSGSIGHPLPGVAVKIGDHDTGDPLPYETEGMLMVKGPNVMKGYLDNPEKTAEVLQGEWYNTGDVAKMDSDGFIYIVGRMSRFSKIGGEMVPHIAIEDMLMEKLGTIAPVVFVTSAADPKKGEQIVLLHTKEAGDAASLYKILNESDIPNLWKPRKDNIFEIAEMPTLGSGKLDLKQLKEIGIHMVQNKPGLGQKVINKIRDAL